jgi:hypothetical protein
MLSRPSLRSVLCALIAAICLPVDAALASGHGAKKPEAKKKDAGHGAPKKDGGHGASKKDAKPGHGEAKAPAVAATPAAPSEVEKLLTLIAGKEKRHDPRLYSEVDLGEFRVTRPGSEEDEILIVKFQIYGVLSEPDVPKFEHGIEGRQQRVRDAVLSVVHRTAFDQLMDPSLDLVKSDLVAAINRVLENDLLRDVAFSSLSMEPN